MSQIENNSFNNSERITQNNTATSNDTANTPNSNNSTTTHYRGRNININFMKEMFKKNAVLYVAILFGILAIGLLLAFSSVGQYYRIYDNRGYTVNTDSIVKVFDLYNFIFFTVMIISVIPPMLSITLFSWVYKRKKVDFIASMPLNKRTIFISNVLLGVVFILASVVLYTSSIAVGALLGGKVFFVKQFVDTFVYMLLAMLFLFGICNLAMSKAGNMITQLVLIGLMLFLLPTGVRIFQSRLEYSSTYRIEDSNASSAYFKSYDREFKTNYLPIPLNTIYGEKDNYISPFKAGETMLYIVAIYGLTLYLFEHRNMEENQESFKSIILHEIVKGATMVAVITALVVTALNDDISIPIGLLFIIISIVYFVIYDFITGKKIKWSHTAIALICTYVVSCVFGFIYWEIDENFSGFDRIADVSSIESIVFDSGLEIKDRDFINTFMNMVFREDELENMYSGGYKGNLYDFDEDEYEVEVDEMDEDDFDFDDDISAGDVVKKDDNKNEDKKLNTTTKIDPYYEDDYDSKRSIRYMIKLKSGEVLEHDYLYISKYYFNNVCKKCLDKIQDAVIEDLDKNSNYWNKIYQKTGIVHVDKTEVLSSIRSIERPIDLLFVIQSYASANIDETHYLGHYLKGPSVFCVDF